MNNNNKHILIGVVLCLIAYLASRYLWLQPDTISFTLAITVITAYFWVTEALPIPLTSVIPIGLLPNYLLSWHVADYFIYGMVF